MLQDEKIIERKNAVKYFRNLFDNGFHLVGEEPRLVMLDLNYYYNRYEEDNFNPYYRRTHYKKSECLRREKEVTRAYNFIKGLINEEERFKLNNENSVKVLNQYYSLCDEIGKYQFVEHDDYTIGAKQNKANEEILYELIPFEEYIKHVLVELDRHLKDHPESADAINEELQKIGDRNALKFQELRSARHKYHDTWTGTCRGVDYDRSTLGEVKRDYRKVKNTACKRVLDFVDELHAIDLSIDNHMMREDETIIEYLDRTRKDMDINRKYYHEAIGNINNGPYYYSFLDQDEIKTQSEQNKLRKCKKYKK